MSSNSLPNYLRSNRKRSGLSQDEVAFLLGTQSGAKVSRYERFARVPSLETALALEVILQKPVRELFGGLYRKVETQVSDRAKALTYRISREASNKQTAAKTQALVNITKKS